MPRPIREELFGIDVGGRAVPLRVRRHPAARRMVLRLDPVTGGAVITIPARLRAEDGLAMALARAGWIAARLDDLPTPVPFADGTALPLGGEPHVVRHAPGARRGVWAEDGIIHVSGHAEHLRRRLLDWLRAEALRRIRPLAEARAADLGRPFGRISVRDTRSRWGSCSANGDLSFCWRLVMAPPAVLGYVVAHEVAHLAEPNHGPRFWATVARLHPDPRAARAWLRREGAGLRRYGPPAPASPPPRDEP